MIVEKPIRWSVLSVLVVLSSLAAGCGGNKPVGRERSDDELHIQRVAQLWSGFRAAQGGKAPANAEELKTWAKKLKPEQLAQYGIQDVDKALISPRDGQPYLILRAAGNRMGYGNVVFEGSGVNGKHLAASNMGSVSELDEEEFKQAVPKAP